MAGSITSDMEDLVDSTQTPLASELWTYFRVVVLVVLLTLQATCLLFNLVTLVVFFKDGLHKASANALPLSLMVADLLMSSVTLTMVIVYVFTSSWLFGTYGCQLFGFSFHFFGCAGINTMTAIAFERHYTVTRGHPGGSRLTQQQGKMVIGCWLYAVLFAVLPLSGWSSYHLDTATGACAPDWTRADHARVSYVVCLAFLAFIFPIGIQVASYYMLYIRVFSVARKARVSHSLLMRSAVEAMTIPMMTISGKTIQGLRPSDILSRQGEFRNIRRLAKIMISMVLVQVLSWWPYVLCLLCAPFVPDFPSVALTTTIILPTINAIHNPVIYVFHNRKYRGNLEKCFLPLTSVLVAKCRRSKSSDESENAPTSMKPVQSKGLHRQGQNNCKANMGSTPVDGTSMPRIFTLDSNKPNPVGRYPGLFTIKEVNSKSEFSSPMMGRYHFKRIEVDRNVTSDRHVVFTSLGCSSTRNNSGYTTDFQI